MKALKWRAEFGVDKLTEETINMSVVKKGSLYTHNRDKVRLISSLSIALKLEHLFILLKPNK